MHNISFSGGFEIKDLRIINEKTNCPANLEKYSRNHNIMPL